MAALELSVVLLQHRLPELTKVALQSVLESDWGKPCDIILVDNGSPYSEIEWAASKPVEIISLPNNIGYIRGTNVGWRAAQGEFILLLNNDIALSSQCIRRMVAAMRVDEKIGWLTACYQAGPWANSQVQMPGEVVAELDKSKGVKRDGMNAWSAMLGEESVIRYPQVTEGTCILVRKSLSDEIGQYWEALHNNHTHDYAIRVATAGYRVAACRNAVFWHDDGHKTLHLAYGGAIQEELAHESNRLMDERYGNYWKELR